MSKKKKKKPMMNLFCRIFDPRMWFFDFVKWTGALPLMVVMRTKVIYLHGKRPKGIYRGKFIVASNHISFLDPIIVGTVVKLRRICFVSTKELIDKNPWFFKAIGCIEIDKENPTVETFKEVKNMLYRGHPVVVFPEGTVVRNEDIQLFKTGIMMMAMMAESDIIPIYLGKRETFKQRKVAIVGDRIKYSDLFKSPFPTMDDLKAAAEYLREKELELEAKFHELYKGE